MSTVPADTTELQRTERGVIVQIEPFYLVVEFPDGCLANLLRSRWPAGPREPAVGLAVQCRYLPERHEVLEVLHIGLRSLRLSGARPLAPNEAAAPNPTADPAGDAEAQRSRPEPGVRPPAREPAAPFTHAPALSESDAQRLPELLARQRQAGRAHTLMTFLANRAAGGQVEWYAEHEAQEARYAEPARPLGPTLDRALQAAASSLSPFRLFRHQARALDELRAGRDLLLVAPAGSGGTLCYAPAIFEALLQDEATTRVLYLSPHGARLVAQLDKLAGLREALRRDGVKVSAELWAAGMARERREALAALSPHILGTTPEMLGALLEQGSHVWRAFFERLRYVVVDEAHAYGGLPGAHMAGLLRRLALLAARLSATPQLIVAAAPVTDPLELAARLSGRPAAGFSLVDGQDDGAARPGKHWAVLSPAPGRPAAGPHIAAAAQGMVDLLCATDEHNAPRPVATALFVRTPAEVAAAYDLVKAGLERRRPDLLPKVRRFAGAELRPDERRKLHEGLRSGACAGVIATGTLESGVELGHLQACVVAGFPGSLLRLRQMAGHAGRRGEGLVVFVPDPAGAADAFYREHPGRLLAQPPEACVLDPAGPAVARRHLNAAALELGSLALQEAMIFGPRVDEILTRGAGDQALMERRGRIFGTRRDPRNPGDPYVLPGPRTGAEQPFAVCAGDGGRCPEGPQCHAARGQETCRRQIALLDAQTAYGKCHPGAVYEGPGGGLYKVTAFDEAARAIRVARLPDDALERTAVDEHTTVEIVGQPHGERRLANGAAVAWGRVRVTRRFEGYRRYSLIPTRRCRRCRATYEEDVTSCRQCGRPTEAAYRPSPAEARPFPAPFAARGLRVELDTIAAWLTVPTELEGQLNDASPCKLPGEDNGVARFLRRPLRAGALPEPLTREEENLLGAYHRRAGAHQGKAVGGESVVLYPGLYGQCLMRSLREQLPEERARRLFRVATGHRADLDARHVCRWCQTSVLYPALRAVSHAVVQRYPGVALGDRANLGVSATLAHGGSGGPAIFWYDTLEGGGTAEQVFARLEQLLEAAQATLLSCGCAAVEGCPHCAQAPGAEHDQALSKPAASMLIDLLLGRAATLPAGPFIYPLAQREAFRQACERNERVPRGPADQLAARDPYELLRLERRHHPAALERAFAVRSAEIAGEAPRVSAAELQAAYEAVRAAGPAGWAPRQGATPYATLGVLPQASLEQARAVARAVAAEAPDGDLIAAALEAIERKRGPEQR